MRKTVDDEYMNGKADRAYQYEQIGDFERKTFFDAKQIKSRDRYAEPDPYFQRDFFAETQPEQGNDDDLKRGYKARFTRVRAL